MDEFGKPVQAIALRHDGVPPGMTASGRMAVATDGTPGSRIERRQQREGDRLSQSVEMRRRDGSVWTLYERQLDLPVDPGEADRATEQAACVLSLLAQAAAATDAARQARGAMLAWDDAPPAWAVHYA